MPNLEIDTFCFRINKKNGDLLESRRQMLFDITTLLHLKFCYKKKKKAYRNFFVCLGFLFFLPFVNASSKTNPPNILLFVCLVSQLWRKVSPKKKKEDVYCFISFHSVFFRTKDNEIKQQKKTRRFWRNVIFGCFLLWFCTPDPNITVSFIEYNPLLGLRFHECCLALG